MAANGFGDGKKRYDTCPVLNDMMPGHMEAQAWGYVVTGYHLIEEALKLLLHLTGRSPDATHTLFGDLYRPLPTRDKMILGEYYRDYRNVVLSETGSRFPFSYLADFLMQLDGSKRKGRRVDSFDWRYYLSRNVGAGYRP